LFKRLRRGGNQMKKFDTVIFDMDGTLLDTLDDLTDSVNYALSSYGYPVREKKEIRRFLGNGASNLIRLSMPDKADSLEHERCLADFRSHYSENMRNRTCPYDGIIELLKQLKKDGCKLAIVSNKFDTAAKGLSKFYFDGYIDVTVGESERNLKKPAPDTILSAIEELGSTAGRTVYVGDSEVDVRAAKNAGVVCVGVTWGFRSREVLEREGADFIISEPKELLEIMEEK